MLSLTRMKKRKFKKWKSKRCVDLKNFKRRRRTKLPDAFKESLLTASIAADRLLRNKTVLWKETLSICSKTPVTSLINFKLKPWKVMCYPGYLKLLKTLLIKLNNKKRYLMTWLAVTYNKEMSSINKLLKANTKSMKIIWMLQLMLRKLKSRKRSADVLKEKPSAKLMNSRSSEIILKRLLLRKQYQRNRFLNKI